MKHRLAAAILLVTVLTGCSDHKKNNDDPAPEPSVSSPAATEVPKPSQPTAPVTGSGGPDDIRSLLPSQQSLLPQ